MGILVRHSIKLCGISSVLMQLLKFYDNFIAQYHTRPAQFSDENDVDMILVYL